MTLYDKVIEAVVHREFTVRFVGRHDWDGQYDWEGIVSISIYAPRPVSVLIHEVLHILYPNKSEKWVLEQEARIYSKLTPVDRKYLSGVVKRARMKWRHR